jgi:hypothetical protein
MNNAAAPDPLRRQRRTSIVSAVIVLALAGALGWEIIATRPVREAVAAYTALIAAANRQDIVAVQRLCTTHYLQSHAPRPAREGGVVGLPRNIHKNFQAWRHGPYVWICPTNRVGPLFQFAHESASWRFDGPIGLLRARGEVVPLADLTDSGDAPLKNEATAVAPP